MIDKFAVGDVVMLNSGGKPMTVAITGECTKGQWIDCIWHDEQGRDQKADYPAICLRHVPRRADDKA